MHHMRLLKDGHPGVLRRIGTLLIRAMQITIVWAALGFMMVLMVGFRTAMDIEPGDNLLAFFNMQVSMAVYAALMGPPFIVGGIRCNLLLNSCRNLTLSADETERNWKRFCRTAAGLVVMLVATYTVANVSLPYILAWAQEAYPISSTATWPAESD